MNTGRVKLFTDSDLDGVSCAIIARYTFGDDVDITFCVPNTVNKYIIEFINSANHEDYSAVFITDLVIDPDTALMIDQSDFKLKVKLFDHHKSNYINAKYDWTDIRESIPYLYNVCGTTLFWYHLATQYLDTSIPYKYGIVGDYVKYVRLWDTWDWVKANPIEDGIYAKNLNTIFQVFGITPFMDNIVERLRADNHNYINDTELQIINIEEKRKTRYIDQKMKAVRFIDVNSDRVAIVFAENYISELGNYIAKNIKDIKYVAIIISDINVVSLRAISSSNINLSEIAASFGGGGHPLSAGFQFNKDFTNELINKIFNI